MSRLAVLIGSIASALCLGIESAQACSCARLDVRATLSGADGAFIGTLVSRRRAPQPPPIGPAQPIGQDIFSFRVDEAVKGTLRETVEVWSSSSGASCGLEIETGQQIGLFLTRQGERWTSLLCWQVSPTALRDAARPLPRPDGRGPVRFLVGGAFGGARVVALDGSGRTLGYGAGEGTTRLLAVCPRGRVAVEIAEGDGVRVVVRSLRTLRVIRDVALPQDSSPSNLFCSDAAARDIYVFARRGPYPSSVVLHTRAQTLREIYAGPARSSAFRAGVAYLSGGANGREIIRIALSSGSRTTIAEAPLRMSDLALDPGRTRLAGVHRDESTGRLSRIVVLDLESTEPSFRSAPLVPHWSAAELTWLGQSRLVLFRHRAAALVFDPRLQQLGRLPAWRAIDSVALSGVAYGVTDNSFRSARLPLGPIRRLHAFPSGAAVITAVPGRTFVNVPRRSFCLAPDQLRPV